SRFDRDEASSYSVVMWSRRARIFLFGAMLLQSPDAMTTEIPAREAASVPADEYALYNVVVREKFLTSHTRSVVLERMTTAQLHPDQSAFPTVAWCREQAWFDGRLPQDLLLDFVAKNQYPSRLQSLFGLGVRYRFVSGHGVPEMESSLFMIPAGRLVQELEGELKQIDRLVFSRAGMTLRNDQALLYVANPRRDGTGAGFLFWLIRRQSTWDLYDTEVIWVAQREEAPPARPRQ
ncbi:MAG TPA: hypothetical protein VM842_03160, partial [Nitrospira sp.]|nr:hypothetical protein [Nitrospira sp.]